MSTRLPTFFPVVQGISVDEDDASDSTVTAIATTSETSYLERDPAVPDFDPDDDRAGPIPVAAAVDRSRVDGVDVARTRVVAVGDVDFATNEDLLAISPNLPSDRPLRLTDARLACARLVSVVGVPALFLLAGTLVWAVRRER